jgi:KaiC/GvpD/RAD55 family RecA-like ATPase
MSSLYDCDRCVTMIKGPKDKHRITIKYLLQSHPEGLTIADVMKRTKLARHTVLARLHRLVGEGKVSMRQINMAKLHFWKEPQKREPSTSDVNVQPLEEKHLTTVPSKQKKTSPALDIAKIKEEIEQELKSGKISKSGAQIKEQRAPLSRIGEKSTSSTTGKKYLQTGIPGFDELFEQGIPLGYSILVAGGAGSGKTTLTLQMLNHLCLQGKKCLYMSFEESETRLIEHMEGFGWYPQEFIKKGNLLIKRFNPFDITRSVDALLLKAKGELLIDVEPIIFPDNFKPDIIVVDSLTAIASAFTGKDDSYRIYIEQLFRFLEQIKATSFLITETKQIPTVYSTSGVEEFLADGVIVFYSIKHGNLRENAIEILKLRGAKHKKNIVAMQITSEGVVVYPEQEVFSEI